MGQHPKGRKERRAALKKHKRKEFRDSGTRKRPFKDTPRPRHRDINEQIEAFGLIGEELAR